MPEKTNPVVCTDAGFAIPAVAVVAMKPGVFEETSGVMTESKVPNTCGSKLCRLFFTLCGFGSRKEENSAAKWL
jgi:hypothetical protein